MNSFCLYDIAKVAKMLYASKFFNLFFVLFCTFMSDYSHKGI
ncbi:hypothetical protein HMPREF1860_01864 [Prevotella amnii]|uniref:Uncharacterized protein n=1 Tax=Prevotella amnii TaxID=419005 RepID=A0A134B598_9BACT|nr:hypothetical protein HMPREF1860_01864 [Prevotella amnii]